MYGTDRRSEGGDVLVFVLDCCQSWKRRELEVTEFEAVWVELHVHLKGISILLCNMYRSPKPDPSNFDHFGFMFKNALNEGKELVVMGDLNCSMLAHNNTFDKLLLITQENNMTQLVS